MYDQIIQHYLFPFKRASYNLKLCLHQDNATTHHGKPAKAALQRFGIDWVISCIDWIFKFIIVRQFKIQSPANSPDLNPIEWVWADLKRHVRSYRCKTIEDLLTACKDFQKKVTPEYCQNFINKLKKIVQIVINNKGGWSNF